MKITHSVLLLSTSLASALLVLSATTPHGVHASPIDRQQQQQQGSKATTTSASPRRAKHSLFGSSALFTSDAPRAAQLAHLYPSPKGNSSSKNNKKTRPVLAPRRLAERTDLGTSVDDVENSDNPLTAADTTTTSASTIRQESEETIPLVERRRRRRLDRSVPTATAASIPSSPPSANAPSRFGKRAPPPLEPKVTTSGSSPAEAEAEAEAASHGSAPHATVAQAPSSPSSSSNNASLILLPNPKTVWQAGSTQTVKWSRKYASQLPADTTVDIVLVDARTNRKMHSLKRFIPFAKGSTSVWVPANIREGISYVLVLELYRGRSQDPVLVDSRVASSSGSSTLSSSKVKSSALSSSSSETEGVEQQVSSRLEQNNVSPSPSSPSTQTTKSILRRSEINIAHGSRKVPRGSPNDSPSSRSPPSVNQRQGRPQASPASSYASSSNDDSLLRDHKDYHPFEFSPEEMRREFPQIDPPLDIEHTFGIHNIVVTKSPYTISWKVPPRVAEWLDKVEVLQQIWLAQQPGRSGEGFRAPIQAKVRVDVVKDQTMEVVSTLARNIPAQTMFMYLQVDDRLPIANYRLRVTMIVVEVPMSPRPSTSTSSNNPDDYESSTIPPDEWPLQEDGWDFPAGSRIIDRYETVTRRFQVVRGAL